jgi:hypothetical protein
VHEAVHGHLGDPHHRGDLGDREKSNLWQGSIIRTHSAPTFERAAPALPALCQADCLASE